MEVQPMCSVGAEEGAINSEGVSGRPGVGGNF